MLGMAVFYYIGNSVWVTTQIVIIMFDLGLGADNWYFTGLSGGVASAFRGDGGWGLGLFGLGLGLIGFVFDEMQDPRCKMQD